MLKFNAPFSGTQVEKEAEGEPQQAGKEFETKLNGHLRHYWEIIIEVFGFKLREVFNFIS